MILPNKMVITVKIAEGFRHYLRDDDYSVEGVACEVPMGASVREALEKANFPADINAIIFLNGHHSQLESKLKPNDKIYVATPMMGG